MQFLKGTMDNLWQFQHSATQQPSNPATQQPASRNKPSLWCSPRSYWHEPPRASLSVSRPTLDPHGACPCTIDLRRQGASMDEVQTHNALGNLRLALARVDVKLNTIPMWGFLKSCFPKTSILRRLSDFHSELSVLGTPILGHLQSASAVSPSQIVIICSKSLPQYLYGVRLGTV